MKTKVLISCAVTAQLLCTFVFQYEKSRISHEAAHLSICHTVAHAIKSFIRNEIRLSVLLCCCFKFDLQAILDKLFLRIILYGVFEVLWQLLNKCVIIWLN